jgi:hypothetical protein
MDLTATRRALPGHSAGLAAVSGRDMMADIMGKTAALAFPARFLRWPKMSLSRGPKLFHDLILDNTADF